MCFFPFTLRLMVRLINMLLQVYWRLNGVQDLTTIGWGYDYEKKKKINGMFISPNLSLFFYSAMFRVPSARRERTSTSQEKSGAKNKESGNYPLNALSHPCLFLFYPHSCRVLRSQKGGYSVLVQKRFYFSLMSLLASCWVQ